MYAAITQTSMQAVLEVTMSQMLLTEELPSDSSHPSMVQPVPPLAWQGKRSTQPLVATDLCWC